MGEREVERADVVSFLRGEERKFSEALAEDLDDPTMAHREEVMGILADIGGDP